MEDPINNFDNRVFEPTLTILKNAIILSYKKIGTRYFSIMASLPDDIYTDKKQIELNIVNDLHINKNNIEDNSIFEYSKINYGLNKYYVLTPFDLNKYQQYIVDVSGFSEFTNTNEMLKYLSVDSYNELLFQNKHRDIVFLIRNPLKRLLSGITQILFANIEQFYNDEELRTEFKFYSKLTDSDIKKLLKMDKLNRGNSLDNNELNNLYTFFKFIVEKKWNWILGDIHTENYLFNYLELIQNINDKSRIKIIDLEDCRTKKSLEFFSNLRGDNVLEQNWDDLEQQRESNIFLYRMFIDNYINNFNVFKNSALKFYLNQEYQIYNSLINSPYFVDLKD
jgi:hypothetical protein